LRRSNENCGHCSIPASICGGPPMLITGCMRGDALGDEIEFD
jgi:hypothetical protein